MMEQSSASRHDRNNDSQSPGVALLIYWENIKWSTTEQLGSPPDIIILKKIARRYGTINLARAYANWADPYHEGDLERLAQQGIEPIHVTTRRYLDEEGQGVVKNSADLRLACDGMDLLVTHPELACFLVVSGDGSLMHLVGKLRAHGKRVVRIAAQQSMTTLPYVSGEEREAYNEWLTAFKLDPSNRRLEQALDALERAVNELRVAGHGSTLQAVKECMVRRNRGFEEEELGIPAFRHLAYLAERQGRIRIDATKEPAEAYASKEVKARDGSMLHDVAIWGAFIKTLAEGDNPLGIGTGYNGGAVQVNGEARNLRRKEGARSLGHERYSFKTPLLAGDR